MGSLRAKTSNGRIQIDRLRGDDLRLESSNAAIEGSILGEAGRYAIQSSTSNAESNLPSDWDGGPGRLEVRTSNGRIQVDFVREE